MIACPSLRRAAAWRPLHPILCCSSRCLAVCSRTHASGSPDPLRVVQSKETLPPVVPPTLAGVLATKTSKSHTVRTESRNEYFQDFRRIIVKGGQGGSGVISYLPTQLRGLGPAAGGNGGRGGRIEVIADPAVASLSHLPKHLLGERGEDGRSKEQHGRDAPPTTVRVPVGTVIRAIWELMEPGQKIILSPGGIAGRGNMHFVSHEMSSPQVACHGELPLTMYVTFELKSVADVGLVGLPNAGKSTVLSAVTRAHPKIAPYPFTTLNPYIGTVRFPDGSGFTIADIPGLVAGAAEDKGLGHRFLRHVVRSNVLVYMIDLARGVPEGLRILQDELELYQQGFTRKPSIVIANKCDAFSDPVVGAAVLQRLVDSTSLPVIPISAKEGQNVTTMVAMLRQFVEDAAIARERSA
ncbi:hypothetical protein CXG81DRAFT_14862 [Caulochytrium protostelioides]|uniref:GTP-binding protein Obg/CgtA n=1 Tax=Caulochytrium protostelioides TaxID=1555241 RepID=A0A4P9WVF0_9FUNG|nr:GTP-binding protein Obg/CgtA [Caulochytrium protostelioides]RKO99184.1 hypothetical protein CXG81DRAFT_14862 [Caulochytrium protostelioides]|eukprot:RKO99184.1 hypothetical protein CXG81DRAFT_14862 [Caulochytrium protostelioides]